MRAINHRNKRKGSSEGLGIERRRKGEHEENSNIAKTKGKKRITWGEEKIN